MVVNEETVSLQAQQVTCFLLITDNDYTKWMLRKPNILYLIILSWAVSVACGLLQKEDEVKDAFNTQSLTCM